MNKVGIAAGIGRSSWLFSLFLMDATTGTLRCARNHNGAGSKLVLL